MSTFQRSTTLWAGANLAFGILLLCALQFGGATEILFYIILAGSLCGEIGAIAFLKAYPNPPAQFMIPPNNQKAITWTSRGISVAFLLLSIAYQNPGIITGITALGILEEILRREAFGTQTT